MMANYERMTQLLERMLHPQYVKIVEEELGTLSEDPLIVNLLVMALRDRKIPHSSKLAAATTLNRTLLEYFQNFEEPIMIELLVELTFDMGVEFKLKRAVEPAFIALLELAEEETIMRVFSAINELMRSIDPAVLTQHSIEGTEQMQDGPGKASIELQKVGMVYHIYKCVLDASNHMYPLCSQISKTLPKYLDLIPIIPHLDCYLTLYRIADFLAGFLEKIGQSSLQGMEDYVKWFTKQNSLLEWIFKIYSLRGVQGQSWVSMSAQPHHTELNDLKKRAAEGNVMFYAVQQCLIHLTVSSTPKDELTNLEGHNVIRRLLINTLTVYGGCYGQMNSYQGFVTALMKCLVMLYQQQKQQFAGAVTTLMHQIVFPFLQIKPDELQKFQDEPEEFNCLSQDCCDHQRFGILKTDTAMLLENLCDEDEYAATYCIQHCIISLKVRLGLDPNFDSQVPNFLPIETALLCLSILSYKIGKFEGQMQELKKILGFERVCSQLSKLQLSRLFSFLAYNYGEIYKNPLEGEQWIGLALQADQHPTLEIAALDFITNVVEEYINIDFIHKFAIRTLSKGTLHLGALIKMISIHMSKIAEPDMIALVDILLRLIVREVQNYDNRTKTHIMDLNNILKLYVKILQKENYLTNKPALLQKMWQIVDYLPLLEKVNLDDDLVRIITHFINIEPIITQQIMITIQPLTDIFRNGRHNCTAYLVYYSTIAMKSHSSIAAHIAPFIIQAFQKTLDEGIKETRVTKGKVAIGTILLILQNILAVHGNDIAGDLIDQFVSVALKIIPEDDNPEDKIDLTLLARALNLLFLCHMYRKNDFALRRMLLFQDCVLFHSHDLRVLCLCLAKEIMRETDVIAVTEMINLMVRAISASKENPIPIKPKYSALSIKPSSTKIKIKRVEDYQYVLKTMSTPFPNDALPESQLQTMIETMKNNNPYLYHSIVTSLNKSVYHQLKELMCEVIVQGKKRHIVHVGNLKENGKISLQVGRSLRISKRNFESGGSEDEDDKLEEDMESKRSNLKTKKKRLREDTQPREEELQ